MYKALVSANVRVDNSVDSERVYDISGNANISGSGDSGSVGGIDGGEVRRVSDGVEVASFGSYGDNSLNINHRNTDAAEQCAVTSAVNAFISDVKAKVQAVAPVSL